MASERWILTEEERKLYARALTEELATLRAKAGISQIELCNLIGISRQTYSALEGKKREMNWTTYMSLILFFDSDLDTREMLRTLPAYPGELFLRINAGRNPDKLVLGQEAVELEEIMQDLDDQARHALKTVLLVEYARCKKIPGEIVIKAYDGLSPGGKKTEDAAEQALMNIRNKRNL